MFAPRHRDTNTSKIKNTLHHLNMNDVNLLNRFLYLQHIIKSILFHCRSRLTSKSRYSNMVHFKEAAVAVIAMFALSNKYSSAFVPSKLSTFTSQIVETPLSFGTNGLIPQTPDTSLQMGFVEDFLAGTDNEKRKAENEAYLSTLSQRVERINALEPNIEDLGDDELLEKTSEFRQRIKDGEDINGPLLEEAFAVVREAAW